MLLFILWALTVLVPFGATLTVPPKISSIVAIGDSVTDNGRLYTLLTEALGKPAPLPGLPWYGHRASNGPTWIENLANITGIPLTDLAVAGASSNNSKVSIVDRYDNKTMVVPDAIDQTITYLSSRGPSTAPIENTLFTFLTGANDIFTVEQTQGSDVTSTIENIINYLKGQGAQHFMIANYYDINDIPAALNVAPSTRAAWNNFGSSYTDATRALAKSCGAIYVDAYSLFRLIKADPTAYGFQGNYSLSCIKQGTSTTPTTYCSSPDKYVFWDDRHPTAQSHRIIGNAAADALKDYLN